MKLLIIRKVVQPHIIGLVLILSGIALSLFTNWSLIFAMVLSTFGTMGAMGSTHTEYKDIMAYRLFFMEDEYATQKFLHIKSWLCIVFASFETLLNQYPLILWFLKPDKGSVLSNIVCAIFYIVSISTCLSLLRNAIGMLSAKAEAEALDELANRMADKFERQNKKQ